MGRALDCPLIYCTFEQIWNAYSWDLVSTLKKYWAGPKFFRWHRLIILAKTLLFLKQFSLNRWKFEFFNWAHIYLSFTLAAHFNEGFEAEDDILFYIITSGAESQSRSREPGPRARAKNQSRERCRAESRSRESEPEPTSRESEPEPSKKHAAPPTLETIYVGFSLSQSPIGLSLIKLQYCVSVCRTGVRRPGPLEEMWRQPSTPTPSTPLPRWGISFEFYDSSVY